MKPVVKTSISLRYLYLNLLGTPCKLANTISKKKKKKKATEYKYWSNNIYILLRIVKILNIFYSQKSST